MSTMTLEMDTLKTRLRSTWMAGDYGYFAKFMQPGAMEFLKRIAVAPGTRMLDVACGAGQISIPAARAGAHVIGIDIASNLIDQAQDRARAEGLDARFDEGDAEMLPYDDASFDLVVSLIGAMFAPVPERVAAELVRVCRPGGRIVMANWTPQGHVGQMFRIIGKHLPPPPLMASPVKWGDEATVRERLKDGIASLHVSRRLYPMRYPFPPSEVVEFFRLYYGPTNRAFSVLDGPARSALRQDLEELWDLNNLAGSGATYVKAEYLEMVAIRD